MEQISERQEKVLNYLKEHNIPFSCYNHPEGKTIEEAKRWWKDDGSVHCKNLFFRNHKGNRHYLVCFNCDHDLAIHDLHDAARAQALFERGVAALKNPSDRDLLAKTYSEARTRLDVRPPRPPLHLHPE